jgi:predicted GH43/DUF377 family glycosyl hydrolase
MSGVWFAGGIVEYDANTWAMVYLNTDGTMEYATAAKAAPHTWTKAAADNPILSPAGAGTLRGCAVIKDGATYHVLYDTVGQICYASGDALNNLTKYDADDTPVFSGQGSDWESFVRHPALIKVGSTYHMFYDGRDTNATSAFGAIGHATSSDMITWARDAGNPVIDTGVNWEATDTGAPGIILHEGLYYLFYAGYDNYGNPTTHWIGYATSSSIDGPWTKADDNPVIWTGMDAALFDNEIVTAPIPAIMGDAFVVYYTGKKATAVYAIGYATWTAAP